jgi:hypothetical protein
MRSKRVSAKMNTVKMGVVTIRENSGYRSYMVSDFEQWQADLETLTSFHFANNLGQFTARKERRRNTDYWYGYRKATSGKVHKIYLGKNELLTSDYMGTKAAELERKCEHGLITPLSPDTQQTHEISCAQLPHRPPQG